MTDNEIVKLFWDRDESAVKTLSEKFGAFCKKIAYNILGDQRDAEECVNDTYLKIWSSIPPEKPNNLSAYLGRITRNLSLDIYRKRTAEKRKDGNMTVLLDELAECLPLYGTDVESEIDKKELTSAINAFLGELPKEKRMIFVYRYWYSASVSDIAAKTGKTSGNVSVILNRTRTDLKKHLEERGFTV